MNKKRSSCWCAIGVITALFLVSVLVIVFIKSGPTQSSEVAAWVGATGSILAALGAFYAAKVALHIGTQEFERLREKDRSQAIVLLNTIKPELQSIQSAVGVLIAVLDLAKLRADSNKQPGAYFKFSSNEIVCITSAMERLRTPVLDRFLPDLGSLPEDLGEHSVYIISRVVSLKDKLSILDVGSNMSYSCESISSHFKSIVTAAEYVKNLADKVLNYTNPVRV